MAGMAALLVWSVPAAAAPDVRGDYAGKGEGNLSVRTLILDSETGEVAAEVVTGAPGCGGGFVGIGELKEGVLALKPWRKEEGAEECVVTLRFDPTGKSATIEESECSYYHGAACAFSGTVKKAR